MKRFGVLVMLASLAAAPAAAMSTAGWMVSASSFEKDGVKPDNAFDGNMGTRWSSNFSDPQWLAVDFGSVREICGAVISWEAAYAKSYELQVSNDGVVWKTVYETKDSDGGTDDVYFPKTKTRHFRIYGRERATSWGYSAFEVKLKGGDEVPAFKASSETDGHGARRAMDGSLDTFWRTESGKDEWFEVDLKKDKSIGGFELDWGNNYAKEYQISGSRDGNAWEKLYETKKGSGGKDLCYTNKTIVRYIKIELLKSSGGAYDLKELSLKGQDESASPVKTYELAAAKAPEGYYPRWLKKEQVFWTVMGVEKDSEESLLTEDGAVEPFYKAFTLMPFLYINGKLVSPGQAKVSQSMEKGYLPVPSVTWEAGNLKFTETVFAAGENGKSGTYVRYTVLNAGKETASGKIFAAIRPLQATPPWQYGGLSEIRNIKFSRQAYLTAVVNDKPGVVSFTAPDALGAQASAAGDVTENLRYGTVPEAREASDPDKYASAAFAYDFRLAPGAAKEVYFYLPTRAGSEYAKNDGKALPEYYGGLMKAVMDKWEAKLGAAQFNIPDTGLLNAMKANIAYILITKDGPLLQPGARNYQRAWMRDGAIIEAAMLRAGYPDESREFVDFMATMMQPDGYMPPIIEVNKVPDWCKSWKEYDAQGEFIYSVAEYYRFTRDMEFLKGKLDAVKKDLECMSALRKTRMTDEYRNGPDDKKRYYGLLPESNSHEGYFPAVHSYWDDFFALKGWKDASEIGGYLKDRELQKSAARDADDFRNSLYDSMRLVMKMKNLTTVPASADLGDFDPTSTAIGVFPCGELARMPQPATDITFKKYYDETFLPKTKPGWKGGFTPYEQRNAMYFLLTGDKDKALAMLDYFLTVMRPRAWNHLAEVVFSNYRQGQYLGDMPHTWISGEVISTLRSLLVYEDGDRLVLAGGAADSWFRAGDGFGGKGMPTYWGTLSYTAKEENGMLKISASGTAKPPKGFCFKVPSDRQLKTLVINGKEIQHFSQDEVLFQGLPAEITGVTEAK